MVELECNDISARSTSSVISFSDRVRLIGEAAEDKLTANSESTFPVIPAWLLEQANSADFIARFGPLMKSVLQKKDPFTIEHADTIFKLAPEQILAPFLRRLVEFAVTGRTNRQGQLSPGTGHVCLVVPQELAERSQLALSRACRTGAINAETAKFCDQTTAMISCWLVQHVNNLWTEETKELVVAFFNCGFAETSCATVKISVEAEEGAVPMGNKFVKILKKSVDSSVGVVDIQRLAALELEQKLATKGADARVSLSDFFSPSIETRNVRALKSSVRLFKNAGKVVKDLSASASTQMTWSTENDDYTIELTRVRMEELCHAHGITQKIQAVISNGLAKDAGDLLGVELVGGGSRIAFVQTLIAGHAGSESLLRRTLDGSAFAATGATYLASGVAPEIPGVMRMKEIKDVWDSGAHKREDYMHTEKMMREIETMHNEMLHARNMAEAKVMELEKVAQLTKCTALEGYLKEKSQLLDDGFETTDEMDDSPVNESESSSNAVTARSVNLQARYAQLTREMEDKAHELCPAYFEEEQRKREEIERNLEQSMQNAPMAEKEDHDTRRLPNSQRLTLAAKNKAEGNELLAGGMISLAAQHYIKACNHLAKMFDENPTELLEKKQLEIQCRLNLAQVYMKEGSEQAVKKAIVESNLALAIIPSNPKAYWRRGHCHEKLKDYKAARDDFLQCQKLQTVEDPAVAKAIERMDKFLAEEKSRARKLFSRMFGN